MPVAIEDPSVAHASRNRKRKFGHLSKQVHIRYMRYTAEPDTEKIRAIKQKSTTALEGSHGKFTGRVYKL